MQRYILIRFLQSLLALWVMSVIVFSLARMTGDPLERLSTVAAWEMFRKPPAKGNFDYNLKRLSGGRVV